jgi:phosphatidylglycerophosphatase A
MKLAQPSWTRSLPTSLVVNGATLGPIGRKLPAPGTWGSVAGLLYFLLIIAGRVDVFGNLLFSAIGAYVAVAICGEAEIRLHRTDPGMIILDEFVAMPLCFLGWESLPSPLPLRAVILLLAGFGLFRFYDILKPLGISRLQRLPGGWGVVLDDTAAALAACATLHVATWALFAFRS